MSTPHLRLVRLADDGHQTLGALGVYPSKASRTPKALAFTVERPWKGNARRVSCIPTGEYRLELRRSERFGLHLHVRGVEPARSFVLIHPGNKVEDVVGCIAPGNEARDIDGDGDLDVIESRDAFDALLDLVPEAGATDATLTITNAF